MLYKFYAVMLTLVCLWTSAYLAYLTFAYAIPSWDWSIFVGIMMTLVYAWGAYISAKITVLEFRR